MIEAQCALTSLVVREAVAHHFVFRTFGAPAGFFLFLCEAIRLARIPCKYERNFNLICHFNRRRLIWLFSLVFFFSSSGKFLSCTNHFSVYVTLAKRFKWVTDGMYVCMYDTMAKKKSREKMTRFLWRDKDGFFFFFFVRLSLPWELICMIRLCNGNFRQISFYFCSAVEHMRFFFFG